MMPWERCRYSRPRRSPNAFCRCIFTGNGTEDILWHNVISGDVAEWIIQNGHYAAAVDFGPVPGWQVAGVGDFTGTGTSDVLWHAGS